MRIAFVNQPIDTIIPPNQNSVGACTYWVARPLAQAAEVLVYGITDNHGNPAPVAAESGIDFRFFPATRPAHRLFQLRAGYFQITAGELRPICINRSATSSICNIVPNTLR
jgi:hypothetical protein